MRLCHLISFFCLPLLAAAMPVSVTGPVLNSERSARSLSDERLYDTVTRVSARGAAVAVKF